MTAESGALAPRARAPRIVDELEAILAVVKHWLWISARNKKFVLTATLIPLNYMCLFLITVINGNADPTALVVADRGPYAQAFVRALRSTGTLALHELSAPAAARSYRSRRVVAVITIPPGFDRAVERSALAPVSLQIDNVESDFVDDVRNGVDLAITHFAVQAVPHRARLVARELDEHSYEVPYVQYVLISIVIVALMIGGLFYGGVNTAREYELGTIIDLLLSPRARFSLLIGMTIGTFLVAVPGAAVMLAIMKLVFGVRTASWPELTIAWALVLALYSACGVLLGTALRQRNGLSGLAILLSIPLLSLSGAFYPVSWSSAPIRAIAHLSPTYYANALFEHASYAIRTTPTSLAIDYVAIVLFLVLALAGGAWLMSGREQPA
jgi:ABC-2 type transport system permease protein